MITNLSDGDEMIYDFNKKILWLVLLCIIITILNLLIFAIGKNIRSKFTNKRPLDTITTGEDIRIRFQNSNINFESSKSKYGLLIFLGTSLSNQLDMLNEEVSALQENGIDVFVITRNDSIREINRESDIERRDVKILSDRSGNKHREFGMDERKAAIISFKNENGQVISIKSPIHEFQTLKDILVKILYTQSINDNIDYDESNNKKAKSNFAKEVAAFPFDSLIVNAKKIIIDSDEIEHKKLKIIRKVGHRDLPEKGEPMFWRPWSIAVQNEQVLICDGKENKIFVLNKSGDLVFTIGRKGRGPGEFISPIEIVANGNHIFVVDACLRMQEFDSNFKYLTNYKLDTELPHFSGFGKINNILFVPFSPLPPLRKKIIHAYEMDENKLELINFFYEYFRPEKKYSSKMGALLTLNRIRFATDSQKLLAFGHTCKRFIYLIDLEKTCSYIFKINSKAIDLYISNDIGIKVPDFAAKEIFKELVFDEIGNLNIFVPDGIIVLDGKSGFASSYFYDFEPFDSDKIAYFGGYDHLAVDKDNVFLLSSFYASLAIFQR